MALGFLSKFRNAFKGGEKAAETKAKINQWDQKGNAEALGNMLFGESEKKTDAPKQHQAEEKAAPEKVGLRQRIRNLFQRNDASKLEDMPTRDKTQDELARQNFKHEQKGSFANLSDPEARKAARNAALDRDLGPRQPKQDLNAQFLGGGRTNIDDEEDIFFGNKRDEEKSKGLGTAALGSGTQAWNPPVQPLGQHSYLDPSKSYAPQMTQPNQQPEPEDRKTTSPDVPLDERKAGDRSTTYINLSELPQTPEKPKGQNVWDVLEQIDFGGQETKDQGKRESIHIPPVDPVSEQQPQPTVTAKQIEQYREANQHVNFSQSHTTILDPSGTAPARTEGGTQGRGPLPIPPELQKEAKENAVPGSSEAKDTSHAHNPNPGSHYVQITRPDPNKGGNLGV